MERITDKTAILPNGQEFAFWEKEQICRNVYFVDAAAETSGDGSERNPFQTIQQAADTAEPGDRIRIHAGTYRECVKPAKGGSGPEKMITYEAYGDGPVLIKASEEVHGFQRSEDYRIGNDNDGTEPVIWKCSFSEDFFKGYNPFGVVNCIHEKEWLRYTRVDQKSSLVPYFLRRGNVFVDGKPLIQVQLYRLMQNTPGSYWVEEDGMAIHFRLPDNGNANGHVIEVSNREQCFCPKEWFVSYIKVKGLTFLHAANGAPVPQKGALSAGRGHHWVIEDCVVQYANCLGIDIGNEGWSLKTPDDMCGKGYAVVRRTQILDCGVCGLAGIGTAYSLIEDNLFARIGGLHMEYGWEASALKFHRCVDTVFRRNIFRDCDQCDGLWLDCDNYNDRITSNLFLNILSPHSMLFLECNRGMSKPQEILIDNNIFWNSPEYEAPEKGKATITIDSTHWNEPFDLSTPIGEAIAGYGTDDMTVVNNLIANVDGFGLSQNIIRGRMANGRGGTSRNNVVLNNLFYDCRSGAVRLPTHDNTFEGNYYSKVRPGFLVLTYPAPTEQLDLIAWRRFEKQDIHGGYVALKIELNDQDYTLTVSRDMKRIAWDQEGNEAETFSAMERQMPYTVVDTDYFGNPIEGKRVPGPFQIAEDCFTLQIDPRKP